MGIHDMREGSLFSRIDFPLFFYKSELDFRVDSVIVFDYGKQRQRYGNLDRGNSEHSR